MLVDLGRNDVGRVGEPGSVRVTELHGRRALLARHAHRLERRRPARAGTRRARRAARDASPPARCRGAPKVRAMEIIDELEPDAARRLRRRRRLHRLRGNIDTCIAIRTVVDQGRRRCTCRPAPASSPTAIPAAEYDETENKARRRAACVELARPGAAPCDGPPRSTTTIRSPTTSPSTSASSPRCRCAARTTLRSTTFAALAPSADSRTASPGPGRARGRRGVSRSPPTTFGVSVPILGVCLAPSGNGGGVRRQRRARAAADARQELGPSTRRQGPVRRPDRPVPGRASTTRWWSQRRAGRRSSKWPRAPGTTIAP